MSKIVSIGFGSVIVADKIAAIVAPDSAPIKRIIQQAKEDGKLVDATYGRKTRSVIIMDSNHIVLSTLQSSTLCDRINSADKKGSD